MNVLQPILLGAIQGLTEFLPVSSTAHLVLARDFFGINFADNITFDVAVHAGSTIAVLYYFRTDWLNLWHGFVKSLRKRSEGITPEGKLAWLLIVGTVPAAIIGFLLESKLDEVRSPLLIAAALIVVGIIFLIVDKYAKTNRKIESLSYPDAALIGLAQAVALIPGVSRSGATIITGMLRGVTREAAARFTFMLSAPIIVGATIKKGLELAGNGVPAGESTTLVIGFVTSAIFAWIAIRFLLVYVQRHTFGIFAIYRIVLGLLVVGWYFLK